MQIETIHEVESETELVERTYELIDKYCEKFTLPNFLTVGYNSRLKSSAGRCLRKHLYEDLYAYSIEINPHYMKEFPGELDETIMHELIHTQQGCWNHGDVFRSYITKLEKEFPELKISVTCDNIPTLKYSIHCQDCGELLGSFSRKTNVVKYPSQCSCGLCGGAIKVTQNF